MDIEKTIVVMRNAIKDFPTRYKHNEKMIKKLEQETQDLLHLIELKDLDVYKGFTVYKQLQEVRKERRELKDENDLLRQVEGELRKMQKYVPKLNEGLGDIRKSKIYKTNRKYNFRIRKDLEELLG